MSLFNSALVSDLPLSDSENGTEITYVFFSKNKFQNNGNRRTPKSDLCSTLETQ